MTEPELKNTGKGSRTRGTARERYNCPSSVRIVAYIPHVMYSWLVRQAGLRDASISQVLRDTIRIQMDATSGDQARGVTSTFARNVQAVTARIDAPLPEDLP